ncbi:cation transporter [Niastella koreensis]|uniref:Cation diffusion facilitator family transporter n=2 Tax=Niastella koreensis TaxID=354356 RepID=G8TLL7_NIAKG|nr:cation diffusion facilitator family transporter [Niastella koreensis]AEV96586.1 cation diffusion facilitator family transporter [Niastella koreensis GR20-10]OQP54101.1 cation transporter [Niastella koreensis]
MAHDHSHAHGHSHAVSFNEASLKAFQIGIALNIIFVVVEVVAGLAYKSMSLLSDAGHNLADVASLLLSYIAFKLAHRQATIRYTYGFKKTTVLAAFLNALLLLLAIGMLGYESVLRLQAPPAVKGTGIAWVAALGIAVNGISALLFFRHKDSDLNVKGAYWHLLADALVSVGVVIGGIVISYTGWYWLDPVIGLAIMIIILISTWSLFTDSFKMTVDGVPSGIELDEVSRIILSVKHIVNVHHIHIWPLSTTENALTAHVIIDDRLPFDEKLKVIQHLKHELLHHNIHHSTIELESETIHCPNENDCLEQQVQQHTH